MKNFLTAVVAAAVAALGLWLGVFYFGFYLDLHPNAPVEAPFRASGKNLEQLAQDGAYEPLQIRAVDLSASMPGHPFSDGAPEREDYLRWMEQIAQMGANTVQAGQIMDVDFYDALYTYNTDHEKPLYLMQVLPVSDAANLGGGDAYGKDFSPKLIRDGKVAVDVVHGRRNASAGSGSVGYYRSDVSPWTLGYIVGYEWNADTVAYTDNRTARPQSYTGRCIYSGQDASRFEVMLCQVMDEIVSYETDKYKQQRLISFANAMENDPFEYDDAYARQLPKYSRLDPEHVAQRDYAGFFASYRLHAFCSDPIGCFSAKQTELIKDVIAQVDRSGEYGGYMQLLSGYHTMPVYIVGYGFSTARVPAADDAQPLTEYEQGQALVRVWREAVDDGFAGVCMSSWQDAWERRTWNTAFATVLTRAPWWHDLQTDGQNYGLMAFVPGESESVCTLDGLSGEWEEADQVLTADDLTLSMRYDAEGVYLLLAGDDLAGRTVYVPLDMTGRSGSTECADPAVSFERAAEFLLCLEGPANSRLLVQERCDANQGNFGQEMNGVDPFLDPPDPDSPRFAVSTAAVSRESLLSEEQQSLMTDSELLANSLLGVWDTGVLVNGCGDPASEAYDSLADICFGKNCVEVCIPWLLLNVSDPSEMMVHKDYYAYYGVRSAPFKGGAIGLGDGEEPIPMVPFDLKGWGDAVPCRERLKQSYYVVQQAWKEAAA